jgi:D,D-heptose 1,7-bisphosphate phosphatase
VSIIVRQAVILAGGKGTRLASRLNGLPKPLVDVDGIPLLGRQLVQLKTAGFQKILVLVSHQKQLIVDFCHSLSSVNFLIEVRDDGDIPLGTAGAVHASLEVLEERFLVVYGDTLFDVDLNKFWNTHINNGAEGTLFLHPNDHPHDSDLVEINENGNVTAFHSKPHAVGALMRNLVNAALYVIEKKLITNYEPAEGISDFGKDLFPEMLSKGHKLQGYVSFEYIKDLGTPERLDRVVKDLRSGKVVRCRLSEKQKAVFLDRDGTLNFDPGHINSPEQLDILRGAGDAVRLLNRAEYRCVLVTNQPVIARGECSFSEMERIHAKLETQLGLFGAYLDGVYLCPHHPHSGFEGEVKDLKMICECRKPAPGLLLKAAQDLSIDLSASWMVGDSNSDIEAGHRAGVTTILVRSGASNVANKDYASPDFEVENISEAAWFITSGFEHVRGVLLPWINQIMTKKIVVIGGYSGSGKSLIASTLSFDLKKRGLKIKCLQINENHKNSLEAAKIFMHSFASETDVFIIEGNLAIALQFSEYTEIRFFVTQSDETLRPYLINKYLGHGKSFEQAEKLYVKNLDNNVCIDATRSSDDIILSLT